MRNKLVTSDAGVRSDHQDAQAVCEHAFPSDEAVVLADLRCPWQTVWSDKIDAVNVAARQHATDNGHNVRINYRRSMMFGWQ